MELLVKLLALCVLGAVFALLLREEKQVLAIFVILALTMAAIPLLWEALEMGGTCCALLAALPLMSQVLDLLVEII